LKTFTEEKGGYLLAMLLDNGSLRAGWLIPSKELKRVARESADKLIIVPSAKSASKEKYSPYRCHDFDGIARILLAHAPSTDIA
jgi:hypothetical protein